MAEYNIISITVLVLAAYGVSLAYVRGGKITLLYQRKLWNWMLLASFAVSGFSGMLMSMLIDAGIRIGHYADLLFWHVEAGIAMALVCVIHISVHRRYFLRR